MKEDTEVTWQQCIDCGEAVASDVSETELCTACNESRMPKLETRDERRLWMLILRSQMSSGINAKAAAYLADDSITELRRRVPAERRRKVVKRRRRLQPRAAAGSIIQ